MRSTANDASQSAATSRHEVKQVYIRLCFRETATADAFRNRFGGECLTQAPDKAKPRTSATEVASTTMPNTNGILPCVGRAVAFDMLVEPEAGARLYRLRGTGIDCRSRPCSKGNSTVPAIAIHCSLGTAAQWPSAFRQLPEPS
jgi:hypothetical protein